MDECVGLANEVPMERIRDWVGHSDIRITVNTYIQKSLPLKMAGTANL